MRQLIPRASVGGRMLYDCPVITDGYSIRSAPVCAHVHPIHRVGRLGRLGMRGMGGLGVTDQQLISTGAATAGSLTTALVAAGAVTGPVGAIIGAGIAGVAALVGVLLNTGCGQTCVVTSQWANQAEDGLKQNIRAYFALPAPRPRLAQQYALQNFDLLWQGLQERCGQPGLGTAGQNCIADRQAGACKWKQTSDSVLLSYPGEPQPGACWNWFSGYRDPIANDTNVTDAPPGSPAPEIQSTGAPGDVLQSAVQDMTAAMSGKGGLLLLGAAALLLLSMGGKN